ncbi:unnamed protein product [Schistocephalus solidus]|uniref:Derlin n=1 Tax=Schistocephalus solidus TaxID=70667 RepID=A0A183TFV6_SCHSO|nr:unnamed protein product [Schistocephalus solidus]
MLISWGLQVMGAFAALHLSYFWWSLHTTSYHATQLAAKLTTLAALEHPETAAAVTAGDLHVSVPVGMLIEGGGAFIDVLLAGVLCHAVLVWSRRQQPSAEHLQLSPGLSTDLFAQSLVFSIRQSVGLYLTYKGELSFWTQLIPCLFPGLPLTGLYLNPANAVIQTWGLGKAQPLPHLLVYWLSPMMGIWIAFHTCDRLFHYPRRGPPAFPPLVPCALPPLAMDTGAEMSDSELLTCKPVTVPGCGFQVAAVHSELPCRLGRSQSLTRPPDVVVTANGEAGRRWRRFSECRFLPSVGDACRRCPARNYSPSPSSRGRDLRRINTQPQLRQTY